MTFRFHRVGVPATRRISPTWFRSGATASSVVSGRNGAARSSTRRHTVAKASTACRSWQHTTSDPNDTVSTSWVARPRPVPRVVRCASRAKGCAPAIARQMSETSNRVVVTVAMRAGASFLPLSGWPALMPTVLVGPFPAGQTSRVPRSGQARWSARSAARTYDLAGPGRAAPRPQTEPVREGDDTSADPVAPGRRGTRRARPRHRRRPGSGMDASPIPGSPLGGRESSYSRSTRVIPGSERCNVVSLHPCCSPHLT